MDDVPSPIDLRNLTEAQDWAESAMAKRPWRKDFFEAIIRELSALAPKQQSILELGSGPGVMLQPFTHRCGPGCARAVFFLCAITLSGWAEWPIPRYS
jgi:hypothetical protein